ncbi:unnamed protein product [Durusdinium trenchii]|uniref:Uncharacterized protein n=1 Tax=Durusdinium trenchii TaxID=1381693 RepID=A0ABP0NKJ5_9DINO
MPFVRRDISIKTSWCVVLRLVQRWTTDHPTHRWTPQDLRLLRVPSLTLVKQLADWGRDPVRQQTFQRLNRTCKVVVSEATTRVGHCG